MEATAGADSELLPPEHAPSANAAPQRSHSEASLFTTIMDDSPD
jgi:hypothetical protein